MNTSIDKTKLAFFYKDQQVNENCFLGFVKISVHKIIVVCKKYCKDDGAME